jgi:hypothetical protein
VAVDTIEKALVSILKNDADVASLVSSRIYPHVMPDVAAVPAITYEQASGERDHVIAGPTGFALPEYEMTCWDDSYGTARTLATYVRKALDGYAGTVGTVIIHVAMLYDESDTFVQKSDLRSTRRFGKQLLFRVWHAEAA